MLATKIFHELHFGICFRGEFSELLQLWTVSNYQWQLKQCIQQTLKVEGEGGGPVAFLEWDSMDANVLTVVRTGATYERFFLGSRVHHRSGHSLIFFSLLFVRNH